MKWKDKLQQLEKQMLAYASADVAIAFSGGADSSLLLKLAVQAAKERETKVYAILMHTLLHPARERAEAETAAREMGAEFLALTVDELQGAGILDNPPDRCYRCKKYLFGRLAKESRRLGASVILEGTNEDDLHAYRPGLRAVRELGIISPLAEAGLTKAEVRALARELGVAASDKASTPCLATRFPYGMRLSYEAMRKVEKGEQFIRDMGFYNVRLRVHGDVARIEADAESLGTMIEKRAEIISALKELGYDYVVLDMEGFRSGSMDIHLSALHAQN